ncbi:hypothetical protein JTB14_016928 [Gonioctena quinquepunctata]|nr:hypothetical protein JTB14_016928 [Gonioctena quinquepunctata]
MMDSEKILEKLNNLKINIKKQTDRKATGNKKIKLSAAESVIYNIMQGGSDENPVFSKVTGNVEVGVDKDVTENIEHPPIKNSSCSGSPETCFPGTTTSYSNEERNTMRKKMEEEKISDGSGIQRIGCPLNDY